MIPPSDTFPKTVAARRPLDLVIDVSQQEGVLKVMKAMQLMFGKRGTELSKITPTFTMDVIYVKHACGIGAFVQPCSVTKSPVFNLKLTLFMVEGSASAFSPSSADMSESLILVPACRELLSGIQFAGQIMDSIKGKPDGGFSFHRGCLADDPIPGPPGAYTLNGLEEAIDLERLQEEDRLQKNTCRALRLLRAGKRPWHRQRVSMAVRSTSATCRTKKPCPPKPGPGTDADLHHAGGEHEERIVHLTGTPR